MNTPATVDAPTASSSPTGLRDSRVSANTSRDRWLLRRWRLRDDIAARDELIAAYLPLVRAAARRLARAGEPYEDVYQAGTVGLVKAITRCDLTRAETLAGYVSVCVDGEIRRHFRDCTWSLHVPRDIKLRQAQVTREAERQRQHLGRQPTVREIAAALEITEFDVLEALHARDNRHALSLTADEDSSEGSVALPTTEKGFAMVENRDLLAGVTSTLRPRERSVVQLRFGEGLLQREIGERLGLSQMHVSRLLRESVERMRAVAAEEQKALSA